MAEAAIAAIGLGLAVELIWFVSERKVRELFLGRRFIEIIMSDFQTAENWETIFNKLPQTPDVKVGNLSYRQILLRTCCLFLQTAKTIADQDDGPARQNLIQVVHKWKLDVRGLATDDHTGLPLKNKDGSPLNDIDKKMWTRVWIINNKLSTEGVFYKYITRELIVDALAIASVAPLVGLEVRHFKMHTVNSNSSSILELLMMRAFRQLVCALEAFRRRYIKQFKSLVDFNSAKRMFERSYLWETDVVVVRSDDGGVDATIDFWELTSEKYGDEIRRLSIERNAHEYRWNSSLSDLQSRFRTFQSQARRNLAETTNSARNAPPTPADEVDCYLDCVRLLHKMGSINKPDVIKRKLLRKTKPLIECVRLFLRLVQGRHVVLVEESFGRVPRDVLAALQVHLTSAVNLPPART